MALGRTGTLACIAPNLTDYTFASLIDGAETAARDAGYFLVSASAADETTFKALVDDLVGSRRVDGLLIINPYADGRFRHLPTDFPLAFAGARPRADAASSAALDDVAVGRAAVEHLLGLGHRRIATITGPLAEDCSQDRLQGYAAALADAGVPTCDEWIAHGDWQAPSGFAALPGLLRLADAPTAIFVQNDQMAVGVLRAARDAGLRVPAQLSVIGVDDIPLAAFFAPPLTTLRQDFAAIGAAAARLLLAACDQPQAPRRHLRLPAELIARRSTAPPDAAP
jgi:LacI family repressor for deo operon, udp, cdd, tsx, nupC, and nupG